MIWLYGRDGRTISQPGICTRARKPCASDEAYSQ
jgi:hypothetical protein